MLKAVYLSALMAYASISSGPSAFLLLIAVIGLRLLVAIDRLVVRVEVFLVLVFLIVLQSVYHLSNCSSVIVRSEKVPYSVHHCLVFFSAGTCKRASW